MSATSGMVKPGKLCLVKATRDDRMIWTFPESANMSVRSSSSVSKP